MPTAQPTTNELEELQGVVERSVTLDVMQRVVARNGERFEEVTVPTKVFVRPMPFRRWFFALQYVTAVFSVIPDGAAFDFMNPLHLAIVLGKVPEQITKLLELATDKDAEFFDQIDPDDGLRIMIAVVQVNQDFFVQKVSPMLSELAPQLKAKVESILGQTQSPSS